MIITSMLDDDLYKLTMCQAVCQKFPYAHARYEFINRGLHTFNSEIVCQLENEIKALAELKLTEGEAWWLQKACPFLTPVFIDFLKGYKYDPEEVAINEGHDGLEIIVEGPWYRTILWEVKLMALISELHFDPMNEKLGMARNEAVKETFRKARKLSHYNAKYADFGTRRRFSYGHHNRIINQHQIASENFVGTSNLHFAKAYGIRPIGTQAHEWFMFHGAKYGYKEANRLALRHWAEVYHGNLGIALSDTFTSEAFFKAFGTKYARLFDGVRHDSGDPYEFGQKATQHYKKLGIDPLTKTIVFSDGLDTDKAIKLHHRFKDHINVSFGIGTHLTNDIEGIDPLNMVIKMTACKPYGEDEWLPVVKLSDVESKHTGDIKEIQLCKKSLGLC